MSGWRSQEGYSKKSHPNNKMQDMNVRSGGDGITFCSWNVKGINEPTKRGKVLAQLNRLKSGVTFLQETHLKKDAQYRLTAKWISKVYHSSFIHKSRGVAIIIRKGIPFKLNSIIEDKEGRYLIITGELHSKKVILMNIYAPNFDNPLFFKKIYNSIPISTQYNLIIGGDLNCTLDNYLDRSSTKSKALSKSSKLINSFINTSNVKDIWRLDNPTGREYSFFSPVFGTYSRIDYFLVDSKLLPFTYDAKYHNIIISDHAPLTFKIKLKDIVNKTNIWRFNTQILKDKDCCNYVEKQIKLFFETNDKPETSPLLLWDTFKAFMRGAIISAQAHFNKENRKMEQKLEKEIKQLDSENIIHPSKELSNKIAILKYRLNKIYSDQVIKLYQQTKQVHFEFGDKPQKLLARQLRRLDDEKTIHSIRSVQGNTLTIPRDINDTFLQYYQNLYSSKLTGQTR